MVAGRDPALRQEENPWQPVPPTRSGRARSTRAAARWRSAPEPSRAILVQSRFEEGAGTNPEELIARRTPAASRWRCRSCSAEAGNEPESIETQPKVNLRNLEDTGRRSRRSTLTTAAACRASTTRPSRRPRRRRRRAAWSRARSRASEHQRWTRRSKPCAVPAPGGSPRERERRAVASGVAEERRGTRRAKYASITAWRGSRAGRPRGSPPARRASPRSRPPRTVRARARSAAEAGLEAAQLRVEPGSGALETSTARRRAAGPSRPATPARVSSSGRIPARAACSRASAVGDARRVRGIAPPRRRPRPRGRDRSSSRRARMRATRRRARPPPGPAPARPRSGRALPGRALGGAASARRLVGVVARPRARTLARPTGCQRSGSPGPRRAVKPG